MPKSGRTGEGEGEKVPGRENMCPSPKAATSLAHSREARKGSEDEIGRRLPEKSLPSITGQTG